MTKLLFPLALLVSSCGHRVTVKNISRYRDSIQEYGWYEKQCHSRLADFIADGRPGDTYRLSVLSAQVSYYEDRRADFIDSLCIELSK